MGGNNLNNKNYIYIGLILLLILFFGFGLFSFLRFAKENSKDINLNYMEVELGDKLSDDISKYASNVEKCDLDTSKVNVNKIGKYKYIIKCRKRVFEGILEVKDSKGPVIDSKPISITQYDNLNKELLINNISDASNYDYSISDVSTKNIDSMLVLITAKDEYNNVTNKYEYLSINNNKSSIITASKKIDNIRDVYYYINSTDLNISKCYKYKYETQENYEESLKYFKNNNIVEGVSSKVYYLDNEKEIYVLLTMNNDLIIKDFEKMVITKEGIISKLKELKYMIKED